MEFTNLDDLLGLFDTIVFPNIYWDYYHLLVTNHAYILTVIMEGMQLVTSPLKTRSGPNEAVKVF